MIALQRCIAAVAVATTLPSRPSAIRDGDVSITVTPADFDDGLEGLVRYAQAAAA